LQRKSFLVIFFEPDNRWTSIGANEDTTHPPDSHLGQRQAPEPGGVVSRLLVSALCLPARQGIRRKTPKIVQGFLAKFLERNYRARQRGKRAISRLPAEIAETFSVHEWDRANRQKRGGGVMPLSLDCRTPIPVSNRPADNLSPDKLYDRAWAFDVAGASDFPIGKTRVRSTTRRKFSND